MRKLTVIVTEVREAEVQVSEKAYAAIRGNDYGARDRAIELVIDQCPALLGDPEWAGTTIEDEHGCEVYSVE